MKYIYVTYKHIYLVQKRYPSKIEIMKTLKCIRTLLMTSIKYVINCLLILKN